MKRLQHVNTSWDEATDEMVELPIYKIVELPADLFEARDALRSRGWRKTREGWVMHGWVITGIFHSKAMGNRSFAYPQPLPGTPIEVPHAEHAARVHYI